MAESIAESIAYCNRELNEETLRGRALELENHHAIDVFSKRLGIDKEELLDAVAEYQGRSILGDPPLVELCAKMVISGFLYGVRWEQNRG